MRIPLPGGLPHSEIPGSTIARISPGLFAACHVLHRLSVPRHPPDALTLRLSATPNGKDHRDAKPHRRTKPTGRRSSRSRPIGATNTLPRQKTLRRGSPPRRPQNTLLTGHDQRAAHGRPATVTQLASSRLSISTCPGPPYRPPRQFLTLRRVARLASGVCCANTCRRPIAGEPRGESCAFTGGGGDRNRTDDPLLAKQVLSQLSYTPGVAKQHRRDRPDHRFGRKRGATPIRLRRSARLLPRRNSEAPVVGQGGFEPPTSRLSSARSNQLSY